MAEERIICLQIGSHLRNCPLMKNSGYCILDCGCDQLEGVKCNKGLPRTEAIERMAKAMWNRNQKQIERTNKEFVITLWETIERPSPNTQFFLEEAEAALDALIKGE